MSAQDQTVWADYARQVLPLSGRPALPDALPPPTPPQPSPPQPSPEPAPAAPPAPSRRRGGDTMLEIGRQPGGVDRANWQRLRSGRLAPTRTLDLHGRTAQRAFDALQAFLHQAQTDGVRCVEVITGRGGAEGTGVIRRELPHWLNQPPLRGLVLGAAHPHAANPGAVRLLLRRAR